MHVRLGNKFSELLAAEGEQIRDAQDARLDFAEIFRETSSGAASTIERVLDELQETGDEGQGAAKERLSRLVRLLRVSCEQTATDPARGEAVRAESPEAALTPELTGTLRQLAEQDENREVIAKFLKMSWSPEVTALDLSIFLAPHPDATGDAGDASMRRDALSLIMRADKLLRFKLATDGTLNADTEAQLTELIEEMQRGGENLRSLMSGARTATGQSSATTDALLCVSNQLLGARLRLQSALVRRSASELARQQQEAEAARVNPHQSAKKKRRGGRLRLVESRTRKLLAASIVLLLLAGAGLLFAPGGRAASGATRRCACSIRRPCRAAINSPGRA